MNKKELWNLLEESKNVDIQIMITMASVYLVKDRNFKLKDIIKDIKKAYKFMERKSGK